MKRVIYLVLLGVILMTFVAVIAGAEKLTVDSILVAQQAGAPTRGIIDMINSSDNTVAITAGDITTLRDAGVPESILMALWEQVPAPRMASGAVQPDDARLVDLVHLIKSGMSEPLITEQVTKSAQAYRLSTNDLLYLKQNGAHELTIAALMATRPDAPAAPPIAPAELIIDNLVLMNRGFWRRDHTGSMVVRGDTISWKDDRGSERSFQFLATGIDKVWFTCEARPSGNFCHQINFKIVKGDRYRFQDGDRDTGSNAAVVRVMEALRTSYPRLNFGTPSVGD